MRDLLVYMRFLFKNKTLTLINLTGLSLGISSCVFISIFIIDEWSFDSSNINAARIYRVTSEIVSETSVDHVPIASSPLAEILNHNVAGIEQATRIADNGSNVKVEERLIYEEKISKADANVFKVFTYPFISGDPNSALKAPNRAVLTKSIALNYFGTTDALGKIITIKKKDHIVTGVIEDIPLNSDLRFKILVSMDSSDNAGNWFDFDFRTYILVDKKSSESSVFLPEFNKQLDAINDEHVNKVIRKENANLKINLHLQRLKGLHFEQPLLYDSPKGNIYYTYIFAAVALLILLIGCLNFINFSIVQSIERSKEVGIRKVVGATFGQLVRRYLGESFAFTIVAVIVAMIIVVVLMPVFNSLVDREFTIREIFDVKVLGAMLVILVLVGVLAGSYPAFYTSSIKPIQALKGKITTPKGQLIRKFSIASQFFISIGLIICTVVVYSQMNFIRAFDLGFKKDNLVFMNITGDSTNRGKLTGFVQSLKQNPAVGSVMITGYGGVPTGGDASAQRGTVTFKSNGKDEVRMTNATYIDENYVPSLGLRIVAGRNYDGSLSDFHNSILINESVVEMMGWKNPLDQQVMWNNKPRNIVGIVSDFHYMSLYNTVEPQVFPYHDNVIVNAMVHLNAKNMEGELLKLEKLFHLYYPDEPFVYKFVDDSIRLQYLREDKAMTIFTYFSILTISISCLGLFGLSSLTVFQRKKEIGIRRIIGADYFSIITIFAKDYLFLIAISLIAVTPLVWYAMSRWLDTFPYREAMDVTIYLLSGLAVLIVSFFTVIFSLTRIASMQPITLIREN
ncbi:MAG: ABC transporter permease [Chryseolinea sp.]